MPKSAGAHAVGDVEDNVVRTGRVAGDATNSSDRIRIGVIRAQMIQPQKVPNSPCDVVIGAGCIPANANPTDDLVPLRVQGEAPTEHVDAADLRPDHGIIELAVGG